MTKTTINQFSHYDPALFLQKNAITYSDDGDSATEILLTDVSNVFKSTPTKEQLFDYFSELMNTRCTHEHDCCGGWYANVRRVIQCKDQFLVFVILRHNQNI